MSLRTFLKSHRGRRARLPLGVAVVIAVGAGVALGGGKPSTVDLAAGPITVEARPLAGFDRVDPEKRRFGKLTFRGGLVLTSPSRYFGGWSGLTLDADGKGFFAISDAGIWMSGSLAYDDKKSPSGLTSVRLGAIQSQEGDPQSRQNDDDSEGLALLEGTTAKGSVYISFEGEHRIVRYDIGPDGLSPARGKVSLPRSARHLPSNGGFEAVALLRGANEGKLVAISEELRDSEGNDVGWIWDKDGEEPRKFFLTNDGDYNVTDASPLPDGSLLVLERRYRVSEGVRMRLRHIKADQLHPGRLIDPDVLVAADGAREIDNMEGLATHVGPGGEVIVTMISDDNYSHQLQRTLLLQFAIEPTELASSASGSKSAGR